MPWVRYVPGPNRDWDWEEALVDEPEDGSAPVRYQHRDAVYSFRTPDTLASLIERGKWQRAVDVDMEVDEGL